MKSISKKRNKTILNKKSNKNKVSKRNNKRTRTRNKKRKKTKNKNQKGGLVASLAGESILQTIGLPWWVTWGHIGGWAGTIITIIVGSFIAWKMKGTAAKVAEKTISSTGKLVAKASEKVEDMKFDAAAASCRELEYYDSRAKKCVPAGMAGEAHAEERAKARQERLLAAAAPAPEKQAEPANAEEPVPADEVAAQEAAAAKKAADEKAADEKAAQEAAATKKAEDEKAAPVPAAELSEAEKKQKETELATEDILKAFY